ncbi:MAG: aldehyde dehydrogenase, partial [Oscillospiraceae bacterium]|nr:aldehyde dehydrogenase [Oscillospiraceae bacterium]
EMKLDYQLNYTEEARRLMDERMILTDDVIDVMNFYRQTGEAVYDSESGLLIARNRVGNATFWVKFIRESENSYTVHGAYSHRMNVVKRQG